MYSRGGSNLSSDSYWCGWNEWAVGRKSIKLRSLHGRSLCTCELLSFEDEWRGRPAPKYHICWVERQWEGLVMGIVSGGGQGYLRVLQDFQTSAIEIFTNLSARYTTQENGHVYMNRIIMNAIETSLTHCGAPVSFWAECLYTLWDTCNCVVRA